eukprot:13560563-Ditylum_brightwellii.AAC.1
MPPEKDQLMHIKYDWIMTGILRGMSGFLNRRVISGLVHWMILDHCPILELQEEHKHQKKK